MSRFLLRQVATGIKFDLKATNGQTILSSEIYTTRAAALKGVQSIRKNAPVANLENRTEEGWTAAPHPKFEMYQDRAGQFRFRLKAKNGQIIGTSEGYTARAGCLGGIDSVMKNAAEAEIEE